MTAVSAQQPGMGTHPTFPGWGQLTGIENNKDRIVLDGKVLNLTVLDKTVLNRTALDRTVPYGTVINRTVLGKTVLYRTELNITLLNKTVMDKKFARYNSRVFLFCLLGTF